MIVPTTVVFTAERETVERGTKGWMEREIRWLMGVVRERVAV